MSIKSKSGVDSIQAQPRTRVLAVASGGGHWVQLRRLAGAFAGCDVAYVTTLSGYRADVAPARFYVVRDASRWNKLRLIQSALQMLRIMLKERPEVIISTGAAPGFLAVRIGKLFGARTIWLDSIANVEQLSMAGQKAGRFADLWLTQWPHLGSADGPTFMGAVL